jgi:hypothetical protein
MPYKRTVRCSYCYQTGHNTSSCEQKKEYIDSNPDSYEARNNKRRVARKAANGRRCSYCETKGHTRRTCKVYKNDMSTLTVLTKAYRTSLAINLAKDGLGIGALVGCPQTTRGQQKLEFEKLYMITGFNWSDLNASAYVNESGYAMFGTNIKNPGSRWGTSLALPSMTYDADLDRGNMTDQLATHTNGGIHADRYNRTMLISTVPVSDGAPAGAPKGWLDATDTPYLEWIKENFKGERKYWLAYDTTYRARLSKAQEDAGVKFLEIREYYVQNGENEGQCLIIEEEPKAKPVKRIKKATKAVKKRGANKKPKTVDGRGRKVGTKDKKKRVRRTNAQLIAAGLK